MVPKYAARLIDLHEAGATLAAECWGCKRTEQLDVPALIEAHGQHERLRWLEKKLRCDRCRGPGLFRVAWPKGPQQR